MAGGSFAARTAKKSRSNCGTQSDVLAPAAVARCVTLTKSSPCAANTSRKTLAATDVKQTALCIHEQVIGVAASLNSVRHSTAAKVECSEFRWMPKHGHDLLTLRIDREREVGA